MKYLLSVIVFSVLFVACNQLDQGFEPEENILELNHTETTDDGYFPTNNPGNIRYDQSGISRNKDADKKEMKQAAERVPSVKVEEISFDGTTANVVVIVNEPMNRDERKVWSENIESAIYSAVPYYDINVTVK